MGGLPASSSHRFVGDVEVRERKSSWCQERDERFLAVEQAIERLIAIAEDHHSAQVEDRPREDLESGVHDLAAASLSLFRLDDGRLSGHENAAILYLRRKLSIELIDLLNATRFHCASSSGVEIADRLTEIAHTFQRYRHVPCDSRTA